MVVIERSSSVSSSASSKKEKQSRIGEKDSHEQILKGKLTRKSSSNSSPSTPSKKGKQSVSCLKDTNDLYDHFEEKLARKTSSNSPPSSPSKKDKQSVSCLIDDHHDPLERKLARKTSSVSTSSTASKKGKQSVSSLQNDNNEENLKGKLTRKASSLSSPSSPSTRKGKQSSSCQKDSSNELHKEKPVRKASLLSSSSRSPTKEQKSKSTTTEKTRKSKSFIKSKIKELGPICKKRKEILNSINLEEDIDVYFDRQINEEGKTNPNDCMWLSSGSMSPQEFGLFMSALDPCLDEWVLSFLPKSSRSPNRAFDGSKAIGPVCEANLSGGVEEAEAAYEVNESSLAHTDSIDSSSSSSVALSTQTDSSTFWTSDRTGIWVSLINLEGEDTKFISDEDANVDDLETDFPSPNYKVNWESTSDVGVSSTKSTTQESGSQSEWSSDLLSDSMDWEVDPDDPIYWPYGVDCDWDQEDSGSFSVSPRRSLYKIRFQSGEDGSAIPPDSIRFRLQGKNGKKIFYMSGLSASKIIEFKKGCRKNAAAAAAAAGTARGKRSSKIGKRATNRDKRRVPPILENDLEGMSPRDTPKESFEKSKSKSSSYIDLSACTDDLGNEMGSGSPLHWPADQTKSDWNNGTWDPFNISPRTSTESKTNLGSPKNGFAVSSSVRLKFSPKKLKSKSGFSASKSFKNKSVSQKTCTAVPDKRLMVVVPRKGKSVFKSKKHMLFKHGIQGKRKRDLFLKAGKSVKEFIRLVSILGVNKMFPGNEVTSEDQLPIEALLGLNEFDGHEGVDMDLDDADFSLME